MREYIPASKTALGPEHDLTLVLRQTYARALYLNDSASHKDLTEAVAVLEDAVRISRRVFGFHPETWKCEDCLQEARTALARAAEETS